MIILGLTMFVTYTKPYMALNMPYELGLPNSLHVTIYGFKASHADPSLFIFYFTNTYIYLLVYVDDIIVTASHSQAVDQLISTMSTTFPVKDMGQLSYFLGVEVNHTPSSLHLSHHKYIKDLLSKSNMLLAKLVSSSIAPSTKLFKFNTLGFDDGTLYRSIMAGLQYLSLTRPDIFFVVNKLCQFMHSPKPCIGVL